jgi:tRNA wybutosine-synthesizing protein 4
VIKAPVLTQLSFPPSRSAPTLVLLECVLVYMEPPQAAALLAWASAALPTSAVVIYDPTRPDDAFGEQMRLNLAARGCPLRGIAGGSDPAAHAARLRTAGWQRAACADMHDVYHRFLEAQPRCAAERRELLDELEEWTLIQRHYALALGVNDGAAVRAATACFAALARWFADGMVRH